MIDSIYKQKIVVAECGYASTPMHPAWATAFKESNENFVVGQHTMAVSQIFRKKEVDTILGLFTMLASL